MQQTYEQEKIVEFTFQDESGVFTLEFESVFAAMRFARRARVALLLSGDEELAYA